uniref:ATP-binding protein n=1 Tax=Streptomyces chartreusis TaxID=1969 RepID=UPI003F49746D
MYTTTGTNPAFHPPASAASARGAQSVPTVIDIVLPADPAHIATARRHVAAYLSRWNLGCLVDDAALITSEMVTNAVLHGQAETITVSLGQCGTPASPKLLITVTDACSGESMPQVTPPDCLEEHGRGLYILQCLALCWGTVRSRSGKLVWAMLAVNAT